MRLCTTFIAALICLTYSLTAAESPDIYIVAGQSDGWRLSALSAVPGKAKH